VKVTALVAPYNVVHDRYSAYYREGLARSAITFKEEGGGAFPALLRLLCRARESYRAGKVAGRLMPRYQSALDELARILGGSAMHDFEEGVARFVVGAPGFEVRICVDTRDSGSAISNLAMEWSQCYFKTSYLRGCSYPEKVLPLWQCSYLLLGQIEKFRSLRSAEKRYDLCFTTRVWGGTNDVDGIEHNLRILEALSRIRCRKYLRAYLLAGDTRAAAKRLDDNDIPWSRDPLPLAEHIRVLAESRLNVHRLGMHNSITWRMSELICMGACPVLDQPPRTVWPQPLLQGENFLSLDAVPDPGTVVAPDSAYESIPSKIEMLLADTAVAERIAAANRDYFDRFLNPAAVGSHILAVVANVGRPNRGVAPSVA